MSVKVMDYVWDHSAQSGNPLLVLIAIADIADDNGDAWPGVNRLAEKTRMTERNLQKITAKLESAGELVVFANLGMRTPSGWTNLYRVVMKGVNDGTPLNAPGVSGGTPHEMNRRTPHGVNDGTPKSSDYPSDQSSSDDDVKTFLFWGKEKGLKPSRSTPAQALEVTLRSHYQRLGAAHFLTVVERCKKRNGRSWDYYLNALRDEQTQTSPPVAPPPSPSPLPDEPEYPKLIVPPEDKPIQGCMSPWEWHWSRAFSQLEIQLDRASFDTWMRGAHFLRFEDGFYVIGVPSGYACNMLQGRLYRDIRRVLTSVVGVTEYGQVEMRFEIHKLPVEPEGELPLFKKLAEVNHG